MPPGAAGPVARRRRVRLSLLGKVFLGVSAITVAFSVVGLLSLSRLRILRANVVTVREGILPISDKLSVMRRELRAFMDQLQSDKVPRVKSLLPRFRPFDQVRQLEELVDEIGRSFNIEPAARDMLAGIGTRLESLRTATNLRQTLESRSEPAVHKVLVDVQGAGSNERLYDALARAFVAAADSQRLNDARQIQDELSTIVLQILRELSETRREFRRFITRVDVAARSAENRTVLVIVVATVAAFVLVAVVLVWVAHTLRPIQRLREGADRVAHGDFALVDVQTSDELGELAEDFNQMAIRLAERDRQLARQRDELHRAERLATVGKLSSQISHEIRNPLLSMGLNTELLGDELDDLERVAGSGKAREARVLLGAIRGEIDRLTNVTSNYLKLARLPRPELSRADLNALVRDLSEFMRAEMQRVNVERVLQLDARVEPFDFDASQLRQSLLNLIRNGLEAMEGGGTLSLSTRRADGEVEISVADTGKGIPEEQHATIFEPFVTTKPSGTGLGLPLVREIVHEHGGTITVESRPGAGTVFRLRLPYRRPEERAISPQ